MVLLVAAAAMALGAAPAAGHKPPMGEWRWPDARVLVHDETGDKAVAAAVGAWDATGVVHVETTTAPCTTGEACVTVSVRALTPNLGGWSTWTLDGDRPLSCTVWLNTTPARPLTDAEWVDVALHEMGHCLGLPHTTEGPSVMQETVQPLTEPTEVDSEALRALYLP